jgi:pimeloyl-ACP methyl ester carboxylesterase
MHSGPDWRSLYPFRSHWLDLDGTRCHYLDEGQGEPLLLVHGNPTWSFYWRRVVQHFAPERRVIAIDHVGCGLSDKPRHYDYTLARHVANLRRLVEQLDLQQVTLMGHDWGGAIGLGVAVAIPERFARYVMLNTAAFRSTRMPWRIAACRIPVVGRLAVQGLNAFARAAALMAVADRGRLSPAARAGLLAPYDTWSNRQAIWRFVADIPMAPAHPSYETLHAIERQLPSLADRPWSLIWGMRDWCFTPDFLERFRTLVPGAEVHRLADVGHWVVEEAADEVNAIVERFMAAHALSTVPRL